MYIAPAPGTTAHLVSPARRCPFAMAVMLCAGTASAQWATNYQISRLGYLDASHTGLNGVQSTSLYGVVAPQGMVLGSSVRYTPAGGYNGNDLWAWTPQSGVMRMGFEGPGYTSAAGRQSAQLIAYNSSGMVVGSSDVAGSSGNSAWFWSPATGTLPAGAVNALVTVNGLTETGQISGYSYANVAGQSDAWVWTPSQGTSLIGLRSAAYTTTGFARSSYTNAQNGAGQVAGTSQLASGAAFSGQDVWVYRPGIGTTQINPAGDGFTAADGFRSAEIIDQSQSGLVRGTSNTVSATSHSNGTATWIWTAQDGTVRVGLTGPEFTRSTGRQLSAFDDVELPTSGYVTGTSQRYTVTGSNNGTNAWLYVPGTGTVQLGFNDALHTSVTGTQISSLIGVNPSGQAIGISTRYTGGAGTDSWVRTPDGATLALGLNGPEFTGSAGYQSIRPAGQNSSGIVAGNSDRIANIGTVNGRTAWAWSASAGAFEIGLQGPQYVGATGYRYSNALGSITEGGQIAGESRVIAGVNSTLAQHTWVWTAASGAVRTGLGDAGHTGADGTQMSTNFLQDAAGRVIGTSSRYSAAGIAIGNDAWYFDPVTQSTYQPTLGVASAFRGSDGYGASACRSLTADGILVGIYSHYEAGAEWSQDHYFFYRPDLGFADLNALVSGGAETSGWWSLLSVNTSAGFQMLVGTGLVVGQYEGGSLYVMTVPMPGAAALLSAAGLITAQRGRRATA